jgi:hypothetical protein
MAAGATSVAGQSAQLLAAVAVKVANSDATSMLLTARSMLSRQLAAYLSRMHAPKEDIVCKTRRLIQIHVRIRIASPPYIYNIRVRKLTCALRLAPVKDPKEFCTLNIFRVSNGLLRSPTASSKRSSKFRGRCWILYM